MNIQKVISRFSFCLLAWCILAVAPTFAQTIITHVPLFTFDGDGTSDQFGSSVSGAGDVNGDGFDDLIVGASGDDNISGNSGSARVFSGADGSVLYTFDGDAFLDRFGASVSGAGDVNGDGFDDVIVGVSKDDDNRPCCQSGAVGSARVFSGVDGSVLYTFDGDSSRDRFGASVSGAGDVNGDGIPDMIVGANSDNNNGGGSGSAQVFSGVDGSVLYTFEGDSLGDRFGFSVSGAGDVNGDGFADLVVGALGDSNNGPASGSAQVFSGVDGSVLYNFDGDSEFDHFGNSVSGAGDVNGDGFADLIVGAIGDDNNATNNGSAQVFSGFDGSVLYTFDGDSSFDQFGRSVSGAGDVNGDGFDDLIVGARLDSNNGLSSGSARVLSGADGSILFIGNGDSPNNLFGISVSGVGDVNGDGLADFIVGAENGGANNGGYARVFVSQIFILGDANQDGVVTFADITPFIAILQAGTFLEQADCNQDGVVDFSDIPAFIAILQAL